jgi:hypothetical protein
MRGFLARLASTSFVSAIAAIVVWYWLRADVSKQGGEFGHIFPWGILCFFLSTDLFLYFMAHSSRNIYLNTMKNTTAKTRLRVKALLFTLFANLLFFTVFNFGHTAASHINKLHLTAEFPNIGIYFFILGLLSFSFVFCLVLEKIVKVEFFNAAFYVAFVLSFLSLSFLISINPRFDNIAPFWFNVVFSLLYTMIIGAPDIICLTRPPID